MTKYRIRPLAFCKEYVVEEYIEWRKDWKTASYIGFFGLYNYGFCSTLWGAKRFIKKLQRIERQKEEKELRQKEWMKGKNTIEYP